MRSFTSLYIATVREFTRDRTALFWTLAFPVMFVVIFGIIFSGDEDITFEIGIVNRDGAASAQLVEGFKQIQAFDVTVGEQDDELTAPKGNRGRAQRLDPASIGHADLVKAQKSAARSTAQH